MDLVLSSGFLAFARHAGFLRAVEESGLEVDGLCGTSSGALVGSLWAAGMQAEEILAELTADRPVSAVRLHLRPWRGAFSLRELRRRLRRWLPETFEELPRPFGVGVMDPHRRHSVIHEGPLVDGVAASCAIPWLFSPIELAGGAYQDGGLVERVPLADWRRVRGDIDAIVHLIERTHGADAPGDLAASAIVCSPPSGASFFSLGDVQGQFDEARRNAAAVLASIEP